jgi:hypothetical protein
VGSEGEEEEGRGLKEISKFNFSNFENAASNDTTMPIDRQSTMAAVIFVLFDVCMVIF